MGICLFEIGEYDKGVEHLKIAVKLDPEYKTAKKELRIALEKLENKI